MTAAGRVRVLAGRMLLLAAVWWALVEGDLGSWYFAVVVVPAAALASVWIAPRPAGLTARGIAAFVPHFLRESLVGGVDVARRAFSPSLPLEPGFLRYPLRLAPGPALTVFANAVSLLPGTVSTALDEDVLLVHVLDTRLPVVETLARLEARVARLHGLELE